MTKPTFDAAKWDSQIFTARDALQERPEKQYAARPFFAIPSLSVVYGISGSHKTNLMVDLVICIATGANWLVGKSGDDSIKGYPVNKGGVFWLDQDSGADALHERFGAMLRAHGGNEKTALHYLSFPTPSFNATDINAVTALSNKVKSLGAKILVLDNLGTISGGRDENSSEMIPVMNNLRWLSQEANCAVIIIHHDPKNDNGNRKTPRGHSSIEAAVDLALWVKREEEVVTMTATKTRGARFDAFTALWTWEHKANTTTLHTARFFGLGETRDPKVIKAEQAIRDYLAENDSASQQDLIAACGKIKIGRPITQSVIARMLHEKKLKEQSGGKKGANITYSL